MKKIPLYSISSFDLSQKPNPGYKVEVFDAHRHFNVTYPHRHDFFELLFITHGSGENSIDFQEYTIQPPSVYFVSPGQIHDIRISNDIHGYIFLFTEEFYQMNKQEVNHLLELPFFYPVADANPPLLLSSLEEKSSRKIKNLVTWACEEGQREDKATHEAVRSILDLLLIELTRAYEEQAALQETGKGKRMVKHFKKLLEEKYHLNWSVQDYADALCVTPHHLTQVVKSLTGKTSVRLVQEKLVLEIKRLLRYTDMTATEISDQLHFKDQSYFTRFFRKNTGMTPKAFREQTTKST